MSSSQRYSIVEPHPSVHSSSFITTGRGGAGNITKAPASVTSGRDATGPAARVPLSSLRRSPQASHQSFTTGRGGAGNIVHPPSERAIFSFDEELEHQLSREQHAAPVYHVGRGGAGNKATWSGESHVYLDGSMRRPSNGSDDSSTSSMTGSESGADIAARSLKKSLMKIAGSGSR